MPVRAIYLLAVSSFLTLFAVHVHADDWPQWRGPARNGVWNERGIIDRFDGPQLDLRWRVAISSGYSGPTVSGGHVYLTDRVTEPAKQERVHCFGWETGSRIWSYAYDCDYGGLSYKDGPRASVTVAGQRAYALGAMGHLHCFDAVKGDLVWARDLNSEYAIRLPTWGIAAAPLIEGPLLIVHIGGKEDACLVAFDRETGKERWRALGDRANYSAPVIIEQAGKRVLVCWTGDRVVGLDPARGSLYWEYPFAPKGNPLGIVTPVVDRNRLFLAGFYDGSLLLKLRQDRTAIEKIWQRRGVSERSTDALHSLIPDPLFVGDHIYGVDSYGELRCLDAKTGDRIWESADAVPQARWATAHLVRNGQHVWIFNDQGELIIARLTPKGFDELARAQLIRPTRGQLSRGDGVCWSHPAFAYKHVFARNDEELVCASLAAPRSEASDAGSSRR